jgi:hypothetical protein
MKHHSKMLRRPWGDGLVALATVLSGVALAACRSSVLETETGMRVTAAWSEIQIDQLEFVARSMDGNEIHAPERRPAAAAGPLASGADVVILLPEQLRGQPIRCRVTGHGGGSPIRWGEAQVELVGGSIVDVQIALTAGAGGPAPDGGAQRDVGRPETLDALPGIPKGNGQRCSAGGECASGHCADGACCSVATCGACFTCNLPGGAGGCQPVPGGTAEPHGLCAVQTVAMCGLNGTCNGSGSCASYPDGTGCRAGRTCLAGACR